MSARWQLQDAKNRFSQVVEQALHDGPQIVTRRGKEVVVVLSTEEWQTLRGDRPSLKQALRAAPLGGLDLTRDPDVGRDIELP